MSECWDLIVVGGGTAGCVAARSARLAGLSVLLLERREAADVGRKACGDAMEDMELDWCREVLGLDLSPVALQTGMGGRIETSDGSHHLAIPASLAPRTMVDRPAMGRFLWEQAREVGVELRAVARVSGWILEDGAVRGVVADGVELRARCCLDASGARSGLREKVDLPGEFLERTDGEGRMAFAYREWVELEEPVSHPREIAIAYDLEASNGGYVWLFPFTPTRLNVGIGGLAAALPWARRLEADLTRRGLRIRTREVRGGAYLPARAFLACAVAPGYLATGDAACCVGPLDGAGIHSSMLSGHLAALQVAQALEAGGEATRERLWAYQRAYLRYRWRDRIVDHGAGISAMEALRPLLQKLSQTDFDRLVRLADPGTVESLYKLDLRAVPRVARVLGALLLRPVLSARLLVAFLHMARLRAHLLDYPLRETGYPRWKAKLDRILLAGGIVTERTP